MSVKTTHIVANYPTPYTSLEVTVDPAFPNHITFAVLIEDNEYVVGFDIPRSGVRELARFILDETA